MSKSVTPSAPAVETPAVETPAAPVGFTKTDAKRLASDTLAVIRLHVEANALSGDNRARAVNNAKTLACMVLSDVERNAELAKTARGTRVAVEVESRLRGEKTREKVSVPALDALRALVFGGAVIGSAKLVLK